MHDYTRLEVWAEARRIACSIYESTEDFPRNEQFGLTGQMRRSAVSVSSNIAEGASRTSNREFARFVEVATGSACELETQLLIASDVGMMDREKADRHVAMLRELRKRLEALRVSLRR
jgi:four helix bundle protein